MQKTETNLYIIHRGKRINVYTETELKKYLNRSLSQRIGDWFATFLHL